MFKKWVLHRVAAREQWQLSFCYHYRHCKADLQLHSCKLVRFCWDNKGCFWIAGLTTWGYLTWEFFFCYGNLGVSEFEMENSCILAANANALGDYMVWLPGRKCGNRIDSGRLFAENQLFCSLSAISTEVLRFSCIPFMTLCALLSRVRNFCRDGVRSVGLFY